MDKNKLIAISAVAILAIAGAGAYLMMNTGEGQKGGLYQLDATVSEVNMGQCSATPGVINTFEQMYKEYYGKLVKDNLTLEDAKKNTEFWKTYGIWTSIIKDNGDGTYTVNSSTSAKGNEQVIVPKCDTIVSLGTMYTETLYYLACEKYGVDAYSDSSFKNADVVKYLNDTVTGGMLYSYYTENDVSYMLKCVSKSGYFDLGVNSVQKVDSEKLAAALKDGQTGGKNVIYLASGTRMSTIEQYNTNVDSCKSTGANYAFFSPESISEVFSCIECIGMVMGFDEKTINGVIEDIQLRLFKIFYSVEEKNGESPVAYWESGSGKAVKSSMAIVILKFLGFNTKLLDGAEHDMENLLSEKPKYLIFYTNDARSMDEKMRINN